MIKFRNDLSHTGTLDTDAISREPSRVDKTTAIYKRSPDPSLWPFSFIPFLALGGDREVRRRGMAMSPYKLSESALRLELLDDDRLLRDELLDRDLQVTSRESSKLYISMD